MALVLRRDVEKSGSYTYKLQGTGDICLPVDGKWEGIEGSDGYKVLVIYA